MVNAFSFDKFGAVYLHSRVLYWKPRIRIVRSLVLDGKKSTTLLTYEETSQLQVEDMHGFDVILRLKEVRKVVWASRAPILAYRTVSRIWMWLGSFLGRHVLSFGRAGEIRNALVFGWRSPPWGCSAPRSCYRVFGGMAFLRLARGQRSGSGPKLPACSRSALSSQLVDD